MWLPMVTSVISERMIIRSHKCDENWLQTNVTVFQEFPDCSTFQNFSEVKTNNRPLAKKKQTGYCQKINELFLDNETTIFYILRGLFANFPGLFASFRVFLHSFRYLGTLVTGISVIPVILVNRRTQRMNTSSCANICGHKGWGSCSEESSCLDL